MIHRAEKLVLSSILKAYLGSTFFVLPDSHWLTRLRDALDNLPNSAWLVILSSSIMYLTRSAVVFTGYWSNVFDGWNYKLYWALEGWLSSYTAKSINLQNGLILIWKTLKNSLLEKTKPNLWNHRLLLAYSDIFCINYPLKICHFPKQTQLCSKLYPAGLAAIFFILDGI